MKKLLLSCVLAAIAAAIAAASLQAEEPAKVDAKTYEQMVTKGIDYLTMKGQAPDGSYSAQAGPGVTALITTAILRARRSPDDPVVAKSLKYLEGFVREDGGISKTGSKLPNYETCLAVLCFKEANKDGRYDKVLKKADAYIKGEQWDESEGKDKKDINYGGAGYGGKSRPDLSNTAFLVDALKATGNKADSEAIQRALLFVSRCQNLETELTISPEALKNPDGGFFYTPAAGGSSPAGETAEGGLRSYGAMTYAGLKSMLYAGVGPEDKRVKAALKWLGKHYSVEENPGMGQRGVYYYYHTFAKALDAMGQNEFPDEKGVKHNWRNELIAELAKRQRADGSWANTEKQWMEGDANLATGFALLTLSYCKPAKEAGK
ncbi:MAG: terpene cyclase/mutase family protein [Planctomycetales bacterium]|nr:terpene cyclase/mutase family protein [Planctomycetales bacterium]